MGILDKIKSDRQILCLVDGFDNVFRIPRRANRCIYYTMPFTHKNELPDRRRLVQKMMSFRRFAASVRSEAADLTVVRKNHFPTSLASLFLLCLRALQNDAGSLFCQTFSILSGKKGFTKLKRWLHEDYD